MKKCKRCLVTKSREEFFGQTRNKDGLRPYCKVCDNERRENRTEYQKNYYEKNKLKIKVKRLSKD